MKLTEKEIKQLTVKSGRRDRLVFDDEQRGLAVRVTASGGRTYLCQYTMHGQKWRVPLGSCSAIPLSKARKAAAVIMGDVAKGKNPVTERREAAVLERAKRARDRLTLRILIDDWRRLHLSGRRPRYLAEAVRALRYAFEDRLDDPAEELDRATVVRAIDALTRRGKRKSRETSTKGAAIAGRTAAYGRAAYAWAVKRGAVQANPFANLPTSKSVAKRERILTDDELAEIWRTAGTVSFPYGTIVRMLILTGQRREEVAGMAWAEIADDLATWTIPGARTKNGVAHVVPLSDPARDLLRKLLPKGENDTRRGTGTLVFPGGIGTMFAGWSKAKSALDAKVLTARAEKAAKHGAEPFVPWRLHDLRRTLATGSQRLGFRLEVTEAVLNHISGSRAGIVGVYQRHDWAADKRAALDAWAKHVIANVEGQMPAANVVTLARAG